MDKKRLDTDNIDELAIATGILVFVFAMFIITFIVIIVVHSEHRDWDEMLKKKIPLICSFAVISPIVTSYTTILSILSLLKWYKTYRDHPLYNANLSLNDGPLLVVLIIDCTSFFFCIVILIFSCTKYHTRPWNLDPESGTFNSNPAMRGTEGSNETNIMRYRVSTLGCLEVSTGCLEVSKKCWAETMHNRWSPTWYVFLSFIILGPILSIVAHSPYIAIAYLNDGYHAGSIFIYYTAVLGIGYSICWISYHSIKLAKFKPPKLSFTSSTTWAIFSGTVGFITFLGLVVLITVYFVIIPINKSISDAPNRLVGIYQSGGFLIASFVTYKLITFFYAINKRSSIDDAVARRQKPLEGEDQATWNAKTSEEKIDDFYEAVVQVVSKTINTNTNN